MTFFGYPDTTDGGPYIHAIAPQPGHYEHNEVEKFLEITERKRIEKKLRFPPNPPPKDDPIYNKEFTHTIIFAGQESGEGGDRGDMDWNMEVFEMLKNFKSPGKIIGHMSSSGPIDMRNYTKYTDALIMNFFGGQRYSEAMMEILFGRINPSGKLPITIPKEWAQYNFTEVQFPGPDEKYTNYTEKHHIGYRYFDQHKLEPMYEFGFGISYTTFEYSDYKLEGKTVSIKVKNTGKVKGSEVVQLYLNVPETENYYGGYRSPKALKQFVKVMDLAPGESRDVSMPLN